MAWRLDSERPIYQQLIEHVTAGIISGTYQPGGRLPSVRELASEAAVNPNTMQKALSELEREGLVMSRRTSGRFITEDEDLISNKKRDLARGEIENFVRKMEAMGITPDEAADYIREYGKGEKK